VTLTEFRKYRFINVTEILAFVILAALLAVPAVAQNSPPTAVNAGSFRGRIIDADTGQPATQICRQDDISYSFGKRGLNSRLLATCRLRRCRL
jgi:hypothetical protein